MKGATRRGGALALALATMLFLFTLGASMVSMGMTALRRSRFDHLRAQALALAHAGVEKAIYYLLHTAPDGSKDGSWRTTTPLVESVGDLGRYAITVRNGSGENRGKVVVESIGTATQGAMQRERTLRVVLLVGAENVAAWNHVLFMGRGLEGASISGNSTIRGNIHLLGDGEPYTDLDGDRRYDSGEPFSDDNRNGRWDLGESYLDLDQDGRYDAREPFDDLNGNGMWDGPLSRWQNVLSLTGNASIGNNYDGMSPLLRSLLVPPPVEYFGGEYVETLRARFRVKHGRVSLSGSATIGWPDDPGGMPPVKETMDGVYTGDGWAGRGGANVYSDNGKDADYDLPDDLVTFPALTQPAKIGGVTYASWMDYYRQHALILDGDLTLTVGQSFGPVTDAEGNSLEVTPTGIVKVSGTVLIRGSLTFARGGGSRRTFTYLVSPLPGEKGATIVAEEDIVVDTSLLPAALFPTLQSLGLVARRELRLPDSSAQTQLIGIFYAQERIHLGKQAEIAGALISNSLRVTNVPSLYHVPELVHYLPPGMPGEPFRWAKSVRIDSYREM